MAAWDKRFKHHCDACEWRFQYGQYDMYFCSQADSDMGGTILARYGDEDSQYASYPLAILFRPIENETPAGVHSASFVACSRVALDLHMSGRIKLRFEVTKEGRV